MARSRRYGEDLTVAEWHRHALAALYRRNGHRLDMADRDWTEFCHYCKEPLGIWEEVVDRGQNLYDKATTITRRIAQRANLPALLVAARIVRPLEVQRRIDELNAEIRALEAAYPIEHFTVRRLTPAPSSFERYTPEEFAAEIYLLHRDHHAHCRRASYSDPIRSAIQLGAARARSRIWSPRPLRMEELA